jgi:hypothetical protein
MYNFTKLQLTAAVLLILTKLSSLGAMALVFASIKYGNLLTAGWTLTTIAIFCLSSCITLGMIDWFKTHRLFEVYESNNK